MRALSKGVRVYFASSRIADGAPPPFDEFEALVKHDIRDGFRYLYDLHNHPFLFSNSTGDIAGATIPSEGDILTFKSERSALSLEGALITNGISTIQLRADEFDAFYR